MPDLDDPVVRANALAQTHPFTPAAHAYVAAMVERERSRQPAEVLGEWAGHALTAGYCLRRVEEDCAGRVVQHVPAGLPDDLDEAVRQVAHLLRTEGAEPYLLEAEADVVDLLDRMIASEVDRRIGGWRETVPEAHAAELTEYVAWWVIKGYALRAIEPARRGAPR